MIIELCGKKGVIKPVHIEPRMGEVQRLIADTTRAKSILEWEPKHKLAEGLKTFVHWYQEYGFEERIKLE